MNWAFPPSMILRLAPECVKGRKIRDLVRPFLRNILASVVQSGTYPWSQALYISLVGGSVLRDEIAVMLRSEALAEPASHICPIFFLQ